MQHWAVPDGTALSGSANRSRARFAVKAMRAFLQAHGRPCTTKSSSWLVERWRSESRANAGTEMNEGPVQESQLGHVDFKCADIVL